LAEGVKRISACPSWLGLSKDRLDFVYLEDRAAVVRNIFELSIGGFGSYAIAKHLNNENVPVFPPSQRWDHTTIDSMLRNRATVGEHQPKSYTGNSKKGIPAGDPIPNYYPAVITEEVFQSAQAARRENLATRRGRKGEAITNLFSGLTRCEYCDREVKFDSNGNRKSLICDSVLTNDGRIRAGWSYQNFEGSVLHFIIHPALRNVVDAENKGVLERIVALTSDADYPRAAARFELVTLLRQSVRQLTLACTGTSPAASQPKSLIRRDHSRRFFRIQLWDGPLYQGYPIYTDEGRRKLRSSCPEDW
jgi:recombinase